MGRGKGCTATAKATARSTSRRGGAGTARRRPRAAKLTDEQRYARFRDENLHVHVLESDEEVRAAVAHIKSLDPQVLAVDFETARKQNSYGSLNGTLRLIQLGVHEPERGIDNVQYVIDCHRADPTAVRELFADQSIEKQVHYLDFELEWTLTHLGCDIDNLYDTCAAWAVIQKKLKDMPAEEVEKVLPGWEKHNNKLSTIAQRTLGLKLPKEEQGGFWERADLTTGQMVYAAMDVAIMPAITAETKRIAEAIGATEEVAERVGWLKRKIAKRVDEREPHLNDDAIRVRTVLDRARTVEQLDRLWRVSYQVPVCARNREALREVYAQRRAELAGEAAPVAQAA